MLIFMVLTLTARVHLLSRWCAITCWVRQLVVMWVMRLINNNNIIPFPSRSQHFHISYLSFWLRLSRLAFNLQGPDNILCMCVLFVIEIVSQNLPWNWVKVNYCVAFGFHWMGCVSICKLFFVSSSNFLWQLALRFVCVCVFCRKCEIKEHHKLCNCI